MKVVARHRTEPLVVLDDDANTIIDTDELEVVGSGAPEGDEWEEFPDMEVDPRWEEIALADSARLDVEKRPLTASGTRTYRPPKWVRNALIAAGWNDPAARGDALTLRDVEELADSDEAPAAARDWAGELVDRETGSPEDEAEEARLFALAEPELDYDEIDAAMDEDLPPVTAAGGTDGPIIVDGDGNGIPDLEGTKVVYVAEVEETDTRSVQDLFALVSTAAGATDVYVFEDGGWTPSPEFLQRLQSPTPPPVKQLDDELTRDVIKQITDTDVEQTGSDVPEANPTQPADPDAVRASAFDLPEGKMLYGPRGDVLAIVAAGGADRNRGNAETLRRYWSTGKGAAKIRWNTPGDWTRCNRLLRKHLGPRAAGYCALRHKELTGVWPGSKLNIGKV